ncbi:hypothetical protein KAU51_02110 [Candidatus Parcubacteria bacterium]|nr:hypothetical protein [Candidatus Parcubacteria bacterium]
MKWIAFSGSWRKINREVEKDIRRTIKEIISRGDGIVSGGALNVDYIAIDEILKLDPTAKRIKIFLPTSLEIYTRHYRKRAVEEIITKGQAEELIAQLSKIKEINTASIIENKNNKIVNKNTYHERNSAIVEMADELNAFYVNIGVGGAGVKDIIEKARKKGIPVKVFNYTITKQSFDISN